MKQIINGKRYDTATAEFVADISPNYSRSDFKHEETSLYRTKRGNWFLAGAGGPLSRWAQRTGQSGSCGGFGVHAITADDARTLLEIHREAAKLEEYFSDVIEDG